MDRYSTVIIRFLLGGALFVFILFLSGIGFLFYAFYKCEREPVYRTCMTDFSLQILVRDEKKAAGFRDEVQKIVDLLKIKKLECFIFQGHISRPVYDIFMVGNIQQRKGLEAYSFKKHPLKENRRLRSALSLCGIVPQDNEDYMEVDGIFFYQVFVYKNVVIFNTYLSNPVFLSDNSGKKAFMEKFITPMGR